ncbi:MAG: hypothetical protein DBX61_10610 [Clostridiales bacterium]|nr:MAG: hypothetical protein DBX61_10610 [Clostridiales bacterium]
MPDADSHSVKIVLPFLLNIFFVFVTALKYVQKAMSQIILFIKTHKPDILFPEVSPKKFPKGCK